ncbi:GumC family protein [Psychroflexus aestuariivivens]|uniref:GumC family protein n=1 Tax=Psychroflexus aestuariivivens TaxID=1795040 RepID=UPI000FD98C81|nr:polysaccharide biosynthesis tyrosine autokinase [Psychroflexus aestuariivivens]
MKSQPQKQQAQFFEEDDVNLRDALARYLKYWPWFIISVIICVLIAFFYLRYSTPVYHSKATIIIKDEKRGGVMSELSSFEDMGILSGMSTNNLDNEVGILWSRKLITNVVNALQLNVRYFIEGELKDVELYNNTPIKTNILVKNEEILSKGHAYELYKSSGKDLKIFNIETEKSVQANYGEPVDLDFGTLVFERQEVDSLYDFTAEKPLRVHFSSEAVTAGSYRAKIIVELTSENSSFIELGLNDPIKERGRDILDQLIFEYNKQSIEDKNMVAINTAKFIEGRLNIITEELDSVETGKEDFKEANQLTDIKAESELFISNASDFNKELQKVNTQLALSEAMIDYVVSENDTDLLPANLGIKEEGVNSVIDEFNKLVLERNRILRNSSEKNPVVISLNREIDQLRANVLQSLRRMKQNLEIMKADLAEEASALKSRISSIPSKEKEYRGIERQQNIKEALYLFLLQKREETSLSLAVTAPKAKIVDRAFTSYEPVSPKKNIILLVALVLGIIIPFIIIYLKYVLDNKVNDQDDLEDTTHDIPLAGEIPRLGRKDNELIQKNDRSVLSEAFRILHTNMQYLLEAKRNKNLADMIFVTSTIKGEGKTFISFNLALTLANAGKRVLVIGADLRNPQLQRYAIETKDYKGISEYLVDPDLELDELVKPSGLHESLDLLPSGIIAPDPARLWRTDRAELLFKELKANTTYDYIIVDTAPVMLVSDTFLINKHSDLTLYVVRAGFTEKQLIDFVNDSKSDGKLKDIGFVLNDVKIANYGYGNKYGYGYGVEKQSFWQRFKRSL